jgi:aryl-alcohol dehydrogenase-like predicted oxidoreductase
VKIAIGTANLGMSYGIANKSTLKEMDAIEILQYANSQGIRDFDTAPDYGSAEELVAKSNLTQDSRVQIKIPAKVGTNISDIRRSIVRSLRALNLERAHTVLFHNPTLYKSKNFSQIVEELLVDGLTSRVGVSCYSFEEVFEANSKCKAINAFQVPENILDRRLVNNSHIIDLAASGCTFQVRSIFLQGLLLLQPAEIPSNLSICRKYLESLHKFATAAEVSVLQLCISYAMQIKWADSIVIGVNSKEQVNKVLEATQYLSPIDWEELDVIPEPLIDPRNWN